MTQPTGRPGSGPREGEPVGGPGTELDELLCFDLYAASRAVTATYRPLLGELGLTYPQYLVLVVLWERRECSIGYLAESLRLDHGTLTPLLRRMEQAGLVRRVRSAEDERRVLVSLTEKGTGLSEHREALSCQITESLGLDAAQVETLRDLLRVVTRTGGPASH